MSAALDQRRPSASLRTRRASTVYEEREENGHAPAVPSIPSNHLAPYAGQSSQAPIRPQARHAKSSDSDVRAAGGAEGGSSSRNRAGTANSNHSGNVAGSTDNSKVGAYLLNKRQSVSFGKAMAGQQRGMVMTGSEGGPPVPSLPGQHHAGRSGHGSVRRAVEASAGEEMIAKGPRGPAGEALADLLKEDFDADAFVQSHLQSGSSNNAVAQLDDMRRMKSALTHYLNQAQGTLQTNVIKNYHEFIRVSKDIASLETEMLELKGVLEEWRTVPEGLEIEQTFDQSSGMNRNRRNSLADLQALYKTQLEALWDSVEGAQRFLPVVPNRHILGRFSNWIELNSATYRPRQPVILVLLNDALLIAVEKRRQMGGQVKVVADKCFHLNEIAVTDLKDTGGLTDAIRIKRDREVSIFRTEKPEEKRQLLSAFKKILEDTLSRRRKESVWEAEHRRDTVYTGSRGAPGDPRSKHPLASFQPSRIFPFVTSNDTSGKDLGWIDDVADQLAVHIALREFEEAVSLIEKAKSVLPEVESDPFASQLLRSKIEIRSDELSSVLLTALADTSIRKTGVVNNSGWLLRLGQGERARETFLSGRGALLKKRTGDIIFTSQGNGSEGSNSFHPAGLVTEIAQLAFVCFTLIRNTCEWYMAAYKDHQAASAFVRWASMQVEVFADIFKRQVYAGQEVNPTLVQQCLETATSQAAMLKEVGLDFAFLLANHLHPAQ